MPRHFWKNLENINEQLRVKDDEQEWFKSFMLKPTKQN